MVFQLSRPTWRHCVQRSLASRSVVVVSLMSIRVDSAKSTASRVHANPDSLEEDA